MSTETPRQSISYINALRRVCLPVDGSDTAQRAVEWYLSELYKAGDYMIFVHTIEAPNLPTVRVSSGLAVPTDSWTKALQENINQSTKLRNDFGYMCESRKIPHDFIVMNGSKPGYGIVQAIEQHNITLIVMGRRGLGPLKRALLGSVSDYVLHHADVPCIIVPPAQTLTT